MTAWPALAEVWAEKQPIAGREGFQADQVAAHIVVRWRIRYRTDIHPESVRLVEVDTGRVYDIQAVEEIGRREGLQILTEARGEGVAA